MSGLNKRYSLMHVHIKLGHSAARTILDTTVFYSTIQCSYH